MDAIHAAHLAPILSGLCGSGGPWAILGIAAALFATGLVGGFAHCAPMCGPFVLMQIAEPAGSGLALRRLAAGALPFYHLGRLTTYVGLGLASGGLGGTLSALAPFRFFAALLLALAALSFLLQALGRIGRFLPALGMTEAGQHYARLAAPLLRRMPAHPVLGGYRLGLVLGLLPCGFLYGAVIAAAASGGVLAGGLVMAAFALGTVPGLAAVGVVGTGLARWRRLAAAITTPVFLMNAVTLGGLALRLAG